MYNLLNQRNISFDNIIKSIVYFIALSFLSLLWSNDPSASMNRNITYLFLMSLFIFIYYREYNFREYVILKKVIILSGVLVAIYVYVFYNNMLFVNNAQRLALNDADPNEFAALLVLPLFIIFDELTTKKKLIYYLLFGIVLLTILLTGSRGALLSILISILYYFVKNIKFRNLIVYILLGMTIIFIVYNLLPENIYFRLFESTSVDNIEQGRLYIWRIIFKNIIPDMPIIGFGSGMAGNTIKQYTYFKVGSHNTYFHMILEYGVLGLPVYVYFLSRIFKKIKLEGDYAKILSFIAILIVTFFLDSFFKKYLWNILMFSVITVKPTNFGIFGNQNEITDESRIK